MKRQFAQFLIRWGLNIGGLFVAARLLSSVSYQENTTILVVAALVLSVINALIKPIIVIFSLPALLITLGIFSLVINGFMVYLASVIYPSFQVSGFSTAILAGIIIGLTNYVVTRIFDILHTEEHHS